MKIGEQLLILRKEKGYTRKKVAEGVCSAQALANIEDGVSVPDKLLVDVLIQRLGKSPDKLEVVMSREVYYLEYMRDLFEELLVRGKEKKAEYILSKYMEKFTAKDKIHQMFYYRSKAYLSYRLYHNLCEAKEWIKKALDMTLGGWQSNGFKGCLISTIEMENLLAYGRIELEQWELEQENVVELENIMVYLSSCLEYIKKHFTDEEECAKIYPKCVWLLAKGYILKRDYEIAVILCKKGFYMLQEHAISYFMLPLLEVLTKHGEKSLTSTEYRNYNEYYRILKGFWEEYQGENCFYDSMFHNCSQKEYHLDYEFIKGERLIQGYTQEELIEGIYESPESLSRVEHGKVAPNGKNFTKLMERLHIEKNRYNGFVVTESFEVLELNLQIATSIGRREYAEAEQLVDLLQEQLDLTVNENTRVLQYWKDIIDIQKNRILLTEIIDNCFRLIQQTYHIEQDKVYRPLTILESNLFNQLAIALRKSGRVKEAIKVYDACIKAYRLSKVSPKYRYRTYSVLMSNAAGQKQDEVLVRQNMKYELECGKLNGLYRNQQMLSSILLRKGVGIEEGKRMMRDAYYLSMLSLNSHDTNWIKETYLKWFQEPLED